MKKKLCFLLITGLLACLAAGCATEAPPELLTLSEERASLIESSWNDQDWSVWAEDQRFYEEDSSQDGIRYYGSYTVGEGDETTTFDIVYIPCDTLPVPTELTLGDHTFRSRTAFGLYIFTYMELEALGINFGTFYPLTSADMSDPVIGEALSVAEELHNAYEKLIYGTSLSQLPPWDDFTEENRIAKLKASWLASFGHIPSLDQPYGIRYYGRFDGYDILFEPTMLTVVTTKGIAGETFTYGSSFVLYAYKDHTFITLEEAYEQGLISQSSIGELAQIHRNVHGLELPE